MEIRGLTLIRPWGHAIAHLGKDIENRNWKCYLKPGDFIAIHSGKKWDEDGLDWIKSDLEVGLDLTKDQVPDSQIIAVAKFGGNVREHSSDWFVGPVGWLLNDVVPIAPVNCKGAQGLWRLPDDVLGQVRRNYAVAVAEAKAKVLEEVAA